MWYHLAFIHELISFRHDVNATFRNWNILIFIANVLPPRRAIIFGFHDRNNFSLPCEGEAHICQKRDSKGPQEIIYCLFGKQRGCRCRTSCNDFVANQKYLLPSLQENTS